MNDIVIQFRWTAEELIAANRWHYRHRVRPFFRGALWVFAFFFCLIGIGFLLAGDLFGAFALALGVFMMLALSVVMPWLLRRQFKNRPDQNMDLEWRISAERIETRSLQGSGKIMWSAFAKVVHTPQGFLFYPVPQIFHWLPRHGFASGADFDRLAQLARQCALQFHQVA